MLLIMLIQNTLWNQTSKKLSHVQVAVFTLPFSNNIPATNILIFVKTESAGTRSSFLTKIHTQIFKAETTVRMCICYPYKYCICMPTDTHTNTEQDSHNILVFFKLS